MAKAIATYNAEISSVIRVGAGALVFPLSHVDSEVSLASYVYTSPVVSYDEASGTFETLNTIYYAKYPSRKNPIQC